MEDSEQPPDLKAVFPEGRCRLILIGKTGAGKSSTGNTILGERIFQSQCGINSETKECGVAITVRNGLEILVMDTPGLCDTDGQDSVIAKRITKSLYAVDPGPHAVLLVLRCDARFTDEEVKVFKTLKDIFGSNMTSYLIVIFVGKDKLDKDGVDFEKQLQKAVKLKSVLAEASNRYLFFNNEAELSDKMEQVEQLLLLVQVVIQNNGGYFRHKISKELNQSMWKLVKEEMRERMGAATADKIGGKGRGDPLRPKILISRSDPDDEHREGKEAGKDDVAPAKRESIIRKQELQFLQGQGTVQARLQEIGLHQHRRSRSEETWQAEKPQHPSGFCSPRISRKLEIASEDSQKMNSASSSPYEVKQINPKAASSGDKGTTQMQTNPPFKDKSTGKGAPTDTGELSAIDDSVFIYKAPDKPLTFDKKRRLVEDALRRKIINRPETLNDVQREELDKTVKSVGQKVKESMTKFAVKSLDRCLLM